MKEFEYSVKNWRQNLDHSLWCKTVSACIMYTTSDLGFRILVPGNRTLVQPQPNAHTRLRRAEARRRLVCTLL